MERPHHRLEFGDRALGSGRSVPRIRREKPERVIAPVVYAALLDEEVFVDVIMYREEFDRGDAELAQVFDRGWGGEAGVGAAQVFGHLRVSLGEPFDVEFVDDRFVPGGARRRVIAPVERGIDNAGERRQCGGVPRRIENRVVPLQPARDGPRMRIKEKLPRVEPMPASRIVRTMHAVAVDLPRLHAGQIAMPHLVGLFRERNPTRLRPGPWPIEQAQFHPCRVLGEKREIDATGVGGGAER